MSLGVGDLAKLDLGPGDLGRTEDPCSAETLVAAVASSLPDWDVTGTAAGLYLVLHAPGGDDEALARQAQVCGLDARTLSRYALESPRRPGHVIGHGHQA